MIAGDLVEIKLPKTEQNKIAVVISLPLASTQGIFPSTMFEMYSSA
jgi:hypothetical protein